MSKIYGIDLGTSNSLIGYNDTLLTDLTPSIANLKLKVAGRSLKREYNEDTLRSFKINISMGKEGKAPVAASSLVLKQLMKIPGEDIKDVVISVPAYFSDNERKATVKAAQLAGMNVRALINEPTAAALYYNKNNPCLSIVFDLGGGTFDISVIDSRLSFNDVLATDGLILGGDDFDKAIVKYVLKESKIKLYKVSEDITPYIKGLCEEAKIKVQQTGKDAIIDLSKYGTLIPKEDKTVTLTLKVYLDLMKLTFAKCIILAKRVINKAVNYGDIPKFIFVGGSTRCPYFREWVQQELHIKAEPITYDQDRIVAQGAMYYAHLIETGVAQDKVVDVTKALGIEEVGGFIRNIIPADTKLPVTKTVIVNNSEGGNGVFFNLYQGDSVRVENATRIGNLNYAFEEYKEANTVALRVKLQVDSNGVITLTVKEPGKAEKELLLQV